MITNKATDVILVFLVDTCDTFPIFKSPRICDGKIGGKNEKELFFTLPLTLVILPNADNLALLQIIKESYQFWIWTIFVNVIFRQRSVFNFNCFTTLSNWLDSQYSVCTFEYLAKTYRYQQLSWPIGNPGNILGQITSFKMSEIKLCAEYRYDYWLFSG